MTLSQEQLEWIVSEVVRRLRAEVDNSAVSLDTTRALRITERLVTLETMRGRLRGVDRVQIGPRAIMTPAVIDLLKENQVQLVRI